MRQEFLHLIHGVVQVAVVHRAARDVDPPAKLRAETSPVALQDVPEVVVVPPVARDFRVDRAGELVVQRLVVAVVTHRTEYRGPRVVLTPAVLSGPPSRPPGQCTE